MKKIVAPKELPKTVGYSRAVRVGNFLFISGQVSETQIKPGRLCADSF